MLCALVVHYLSSQVLTAVYMVCTLYVCQSNLSGICGEDVEERLLWEKKLMIMHSGLLRFPLDSIYKNFLTSFFEKTNSSEFRNETKAINKAHPTSECQRMLYPKQNEPHRTCRAQCTVDIDTKVVKPSRTGAQYADTNAITIKINK